MISGLPAMVICYTAENMLQQPGVPGSPRLPNTSNVAFLDYDFEEIILRNKKLAFSSGSACNSATIEPSHVLRAMNLPEEHLHGSVRFSFGRFTTQEEVEFAIDSLSRIMA